MIFFSSYHSMLRPLATTIAKMPRNHTDFLNPAAGELSSNQNIVYATLNDDVSYGPHIKTNSNLKNKNLREFDFHLDHLTARLIAPPSLREPTTNLSTTPRHITFGLEIKIGVERINRKDKVQYHKVYGFAAVHKGMFLFPNSRGKRLFAATFDLDTGVLNYLESERKQIHAVHNLRTGINNQESLVLFINAAYQI